MDGPERSATGNERWVVAALVAGVFGLFVLELARNYEPAKLSVLFIVLALGPLTVLHELGHVLASRWLGWTVCRVVIGYGRPVLRFRVGQMPVDIRAFPIGGHVLPAPARLRRPRLESALIYAAGPAAEAVVGVAVLALLGVERAFSRSGEPLIIAGQSVLLWVAVDLFTNLLPLPTRSGGGIGYTDGLGVLASPWLPDWHFQRALVLPWLVRAESRKSQQEKLAVLEQARERFPHNPFALLASADAHFEAGDVLEARQLRLQAIEAPELPDELKRALRHKLGLG